MTAAPALIIHGHNTEGDLVFERGGRGMVHASTTDLTSLRRLVAATGQVWFRGYRLDESDITALIAEDAKADPDLSELADLVSRWLRAVDALEAKPLGPNRTGDNTAEANAVHAAEADVREYGKRVRW